MELHLSDSSAAIALVRSLQQELEVLAKILRSSADSLRVDAMFGMEFRHEADVEMARPIEVRTLEGEEALEAAILALTCTELMPGQNIKETLRVPGALAVPREVLLKVEETNNMRRDLQALITKIKCQETRRLVWRRFPGHSSKQALRVTPVINDPRRIVFYWDTGATGNKRVVRELLQEWWQQLEQHLESHPQSSDHAEDPLVKKLSAAIADLARIKDPNEEVCISRPVTPHVRARVVASNVKPRIIVAPVPIVYELTSARPRVKPLPDYAARGEKPVPGARKTLETAPYIESMNVYRYIGSPPIKRD